MAKTPKAPDGDPAIIWRRVTVNSVRTEFTEPRRIEPCAVPQLRLIPGCRPSRKEALLRRTAGCMPLANANSHGRGGHVAAVADVIRTVQQIPGLQRQHEEVPRDRVVAHLARRAEEPRVSAPDIVDVTGGFELKCALPPPHHNGAPHIFVGQFQRQFHLPFARASLGHAPEDSLGRQRFDRRHSSRAKPRSVSSRSWKQFRTVLAEKPDSLATLA